MSEINTCRDLGSEMKKLISSGNLSKSESRLYANFFYDNEKNKLRPITDIKFDGKTLTLTTSLYGKGMLMYKFANKALDLSYKYQIHLDKMPIKIDDSTIKSVEGNSITKNCVLVV